MSREPLDISGQKFGKLTVLEIVSKTRGSGYIRWLCECECGTKKEIGGSHLKRGHIISCGCLSKVRGPCARNWGGYGEISGANWRHMINGAKTRNRFQIEFSITIEFAWELFLKQNRRCALSGAELSFGYGGSGSYKTASLDRIDNSRGYVEDNVQWVHKRINFMKGTLTEKYFIELCESVAKYQKEINSNDSCTL